ncbi:PP0621 family protein [Arcobacter sp. YIC-464]|uniref:PP0621 family protein n=1 Tax=Arcobacter sp. YIC-464 TaxID=3376631 RepID=UPI003C200172
MIFKILAVVIVLFLVYLIFFKKGREKDIVETKKNENISDEMVECPTCKTYVSQNEAILSNGKFYCSEECLNNK